MSTDFTQIPELAAALALAQGKIENATKDATNPAFKSKYADLTAVIDAVRPPLNECGISIMQMVVASDPNTVMIETILLHKTGQSLSAFSPQIPVDKHNAQGYGSAITYARRYSLQSLLCVGADSDDVGNAAAASVHPQQTQRQQYREQQPPVEAPPRHPSPKGPSQEPVAQPQVDKWGPMRTFAAGAEVKGYAVKNDEGKLSTPLIKDILLNCPSVVSMFHSYEILQKTLNETPLYDFDPAFFVDALAALPPNPGFDNSAPTQSDGVVVRPQDIPPRTKFVNTVPAPSRTEAEIDASAADLTDPFE